MTCLLTTLVMQPHPGGQSIPLPSPQIVNSQAIIDMKLVDGGGFSRIYHAILKEGGRQIHVAIKVPTQKADVKMFEKERDALVLVEHENVVRFIGVWPSPVHILLTEQPPFALVLEYLPGGTIRSKLRPNEKPTLIVLEQALEYALHLVNALTYLHGALSLF
jgi:serine/threonine protein kinase